MRGLHPHRFKSNPDELVAADQWDAHNRRPNGGAGLLEYLLGDGTKPGDASERDQRVAATLMQWLGSPVGKSYIDELLAKWTSK